MKPQTFNRISFIMVAIFIIFILIAGLSNDTRLVFDQDTSVSAPLKLAWTKEFIAHELRIFSQSGGDGIMLWIFTNIGTVGHPPYFVEFSVQSGKQCNTRFLRQYLGWKGLMMNGGHENKSINLNRERIISKNINAFLEK